MTRKNILPIMLIAATSAMAQNDNAKLEFQLANLLQINSDQVTLLKSSKAKGAHNPIEAIDTAAIKRFASVRFDADGAISNISAIVTLKDGCKCPTAALDAMGVDYDVITETTVVMEIPVNKLEEVCNLDDILNIQMSRMGQFCNATARESSNVDPVHEGTGLNSPYTGKGVVVGIIDSGIDFNHVAFIDPNTGKTRIKEALYFQNESLTIAKTEKAIKALTTFNTKSTHGTHVAATAAGSYSGDIKKYGMAPEADMIVCDLGESLSASRIIKAVKEIFRYADENGMPAVVNISIGTTIEFHDGNNSLSPTLSQLVEEGNKPGRVIVLAAHNSAGTNTSIRKTLGAPDKDGYNMRTVLTGKQEMTTDGKSVNTYHSLYDFICADDDQVFNVSFFTVDVTTGKVYTLTEKPLYTIDGRTAIKSLSCEIGINNINKRRYGSLQRTGDFKYLEENLALGIFIKGKEGQTIQINDYYYENNSLRGEATFPALKGYTEGNDALSINSWACTDAVISAGAYIDRTSFVDYKGKKHSYTSSYTKGKIAFFSGYGIDDNGKARPDVLAPGIFINSAANMHYTTYFTPSMALVDNQVEGKGIEYFITDYLENVTIESYSRTNAYTRLHGTSQSSPIVAGTIALWLQANPQLSTIDIRDVLKASSANDEFTTDVTKIPSGSTIQAATGKLDALAGIRYILKIEDPEVKPEDPETPDTPENPDTPVTPENPDTPVTPENPDAPDTPENPDAPDTPENPDTPGDEPQDPPTGIEERSTTTDDNTTINYNIYGQKVSSTTRGIVIRGNKKYYVNF